MSEKQQQISGMIFAYLSCLDTFWYINIFPDYMETLRLVFKLFRLPENLFHCKETFQLVWKRTVSRLSGNCPDVLETFSSVWKPGNLLAYIFLSAHILGCLEVFQTICKLSVWYISFTGCLLVFLIVWKISSLKN